jgi:hypothetical protein
MELDRPGEERKNRRDVMDDDSPDSDNADGFLPTALLSCGELPAPSFLWQCAEEDDEHREVELPTDVEAADVDASSDPGMGSCTGEPASGRRSREKHPSITVYAFALARVLSAFACLLGANTSGRSMEAMAATPRRLRTSSSPTPTPPM